MSALAQVSARCQQAVAAKQGPEGNWARGALHARAVHLVLPLMHDGQRGVARQTAVQLFQRCLKLLVPIHRYRKSEIRSPLVS